MDMFVPVRFKTSVHLAPMELTVDFEETILKKLRKNLEGVCTRHGYIRPLSIEIARRSAGQFVKQHFNGHLRFDVVCRAEVCNPPQNSIIEAIVKKVNELGVHAESALRLGENDVPVLDIIIPKRAAGIQSEIDLSELTIGDRINVEVLGKRFQLNDRMISIIGRATVGKKETAVAPVGGEEEDDVEEDNPFYEEDEISDSESEKSTKEEEDSEPEEQEGGLRQVQIDEEEEDVEEEEEYEFEDLEEGSEVAETDMSDIDDYE